MKTFILTALLIISLEEAGLAQTKEVDRIKTFNINKGMALQGYDPVSYFRGMPKKGEEQFSYSYKGIKYLFSSVANREAFILTPERFEPQYGGWCAYAIGESGKKVKINPLTYLIKEDKLYLFYNFNGYNTLKEWNKNEEVLKKAADRNWQPFE